MAEQQKKAPVQGYSAGIPWSLHLEAYDAYRKCYGPQPALIDLEGRNCRGGFSTRELDDFIPGWRERVSEIARLQAQVEVLRHERDHARASTDNAVKLLVSIHSLLYPAPTTLADGRTMVFRPKSPDPHGVLQELSDRIRALPDELAALAAGR